MKKRTFFGSVITIAFASFFVLTSCTNKTKQEEIREDAAEVKHEIVVEKRDYTVYTYKEKDKFLVDANKDLDDINAEIAKLKAELDRAGDNVTAETKAAYKKSIAELEELRDDYKRDIDKIQNSTEDTWEKTKDDVAKTYDKTRVKIKKGWDDMKDGINEGLNKVKDKLD